MNYSKITWDSIKNNKKINLLEHPVYGSLIDKFEFEKEFSLLLNELNGEGKYPTPDSYLGFFMETNPCITTSLKFIGEDEKADFIDIAIEKGLMPTLREIHQSEDFQQETTRKNDEEWNSIEKLSIQETAEIEYEIEKVRLKSIENQKLKKLQRTESRSLFLKDYIKLHKIWCGCQVNYNLINTKDKKKELYKKKFEKSLQFVKTTYNDFIEKHGRYLESYPEYDTKIQGSLNDIQQFIKEN